MGISDSASSKWGQAHQGSSRLAAGRVRNTHGPGRGPWVFRTRPAASGAKLTREALDLAESAPRPDPALLEHLFSDLGNRMSEEGRYAQADQYYQKGLAIFAKHSPPENPEQWRVTLQQAALLRFARGEGPDRLDPLYDEALALARGYLGPKSLTEAQLLAERARVR